MELNMDRKIINYHLSTFNLKKQLLYEHCHTVLSLLNAMDLVNVPVFGAHVTPNLVPIIKLVDTNEIPIEQIHVDMMDSLGADMAGLKLPYDSRQKLQKILEPINHFINSL